MSLYMSYVIRNELCHQKELIIRKSYVVECQIWHSQIQCQIVDLSQSFVRKQLNYYYYGGNSSYV